MYHVFMTSGRCECLHRTSRCFMLSHIGSVNYMRHKMQPFDIEFVLEYFVETLVHGVIVEVFGLVSDQVVLHHLLTLGIGNAVGR